MAPRPAPETTSCFAASAALLAPGSTPQWRLSLPRARGSGWRLSLPRARGSGWRLSLPQARGSEWCLSVPRVPSHWRLSRRAAAAAGSLLRASELGRGGLEAPSGVNLAGHLL